jgi:hypothetical protein
MRTLISLTAALVLAAGVGPYAMGQQGKGKGKGNASATVSTLSVALYRDYNGDGVPSWGDQIGFNVVTDQTANPQVQVMCFQDGDVVFGAVWPITPVLTLSSRMWQAGAATCTATAYYFSGNKNTTIASIDFPVNAL